jgi:hypothetical protein
MEAETKKHKIINQFIKNHTVEKFDYGKIRVCPSFYTRRYWA